MQTNVTEKKKQKTKHSPTRTQPLSLNRAALFVQAADPDVRLYIPFMLKRSISFRDKGNFFFFFFCGVVSFLLQYRESKLCRDEEGALGSSELQRCTQSSHRYEAQTRGHGPHRLYKKKKERERTELRTYP